MLYFLAGPGRNIYFPFDILNDTPLDVAREMVKELEITDWEPFEIAKMIDEEISVLVPHWKKREWPHPEAYHTFNYEEDEDGYHHPLYSFPSCSSSQASLPGLVTYDHDWLKGQGSNNSFRFLRSSPVFCYWILHSYMAM